METRNQPPRVLFVLPVLGQPRHSKRIEMIRSGGAAVEAAAFDRDYHRGRLPDCQVTGLGTISHGKYLRRIPRILRAVRPLSRQIARNDVVYAFGPDMALLSVLARGASRTPVVMEIGDLSRTQTRGGMVGHAVRAGERLLASRCSLVVTTTEAFMENYYRRWLGVRTPGLVLENKIEARVADRTAVPARAPGRPLDGRPLRIGYFGLLRCGWSWRVLDALVRRHPGRFEVVMAGYPLDPRDIADRSAGRSDFRYLGEYRSPTDLPALYGSVDVVWATYHPLAADDYPHWWARPNRFYESCLFSRPVITRDGTCDSVDVKRWGVGLCVREESVDDTVARLASLTAAEVEGWTDAMARMPRDVYVHGDDTHRLQSSIAALARMYAPAATGEAPVLAAAGEPTVGRIA